MTIPNPVVVCDEGRVISSHTKHSADYSTPMTLEGVEIEESGDILLQVNMIVPVSHRRAIAARGEFSATHIRDLRGLEELSDDAGVRRAAAAVLRFADGASYAKAVEETGYSVGWLRPLVAEVLANGAEAIEQRKYRPGRAKP